MARPVQGLIESTAHQRELLDRDPIRRERLHALQLFQIERLRLTYADYAAQPRYRAALDFFVDDLYGSHELAGRDLALLKVIDQWGRLLPEGALQALTRALELEALTQALDLAMLDALAGATATFETYPEAYRQVDRFQDRRRQIQLIVTAGRDLASSIGNPAIGVALRAARLPARIMNVMVLHRFLERGYRAFKQMGNADELLRIIEQRESKIFRALCDGAANPFGLRA